MGLQKPEKGLWNKVSPVREEDFILATKKQRQSEKPILKLAVILEERFLIHMLAWIFYVVLKGIYREHSIHREPAQSQAGGGRPHGVQKEGW